MEMSEGRCKPNKDEFVISDEGIMHRPTEYSFVPFPGNPTHGSIREGMIGKVLADGRRYSPKDVENLCRRLWAQHLTRNTMRKLL